MHDCGLMADRWGFLRCWAPSCCRLLHTFASRQPLWTAGQMCGHSQTPAGITGSMSSWHARARFSSSGRSFHCLHTVHRHSSQDVLHLQSSALRHLCGSLPVTISADTLRKLPSCVQSDCSINSCHKQVWWPGVDAHIGSSASSAPVLTHLWVQVALPGMQHDEGATTIT